MYKKVTKLLGAIALTGWMGVANATLIFDFSWDSPGGQIIGVIEGLQDIPGIQQATTVKITSANGIAQTYDLNNPAFSTVFSNDFVVRGSKITYASFQTVQWTTQTAVEFSLTYGLYAVAQQNYLAISVPIFKSRGSVPEPSTVILLSLGLAGLSFVRYRKQS
jgi:hypothetical protein